MFHAQMVFVAMASGKLVTPQRWIYLSLWVTLNDGKEVLTTIWFVNSLEGEHG
jgi:hypothetical protein